MALETRRLTESDDAAYVEFLDGLSARNPCVLGYHYPVYRRMLSRIGAGEPFYMGAFENGRLAGILPGFIKRSEVGTAYCSLPYFGPNAGVMVADDEDGKVHEALLGSVFQYMSSCHDAVSASFYTPFLFDRYRFYDTALPQAEIVEKQTLYLDLQTAQWDKKILYDLRKAQKAGLSISEEITPERIQRFYDIYKGNCAEFGIPLKPFEAVRFLAEEGVGDGQVKCYFAFLNGEMIAGLMMLFSQGVMSYYIPCTLTSARATQPSSTLIDYCVQQSRQMKVRYWNWESSPSKESGVYQFKNKWGSVEKDYRIYVRLFCGKDKLKALGQQKIAESFPYFFVYPFNRL
ncbi:MAG TPA: GNAT family N-acetyltransferase [Elusimicrobiales bacterium]|nr:GNAT family N-acetyltransferase [Elusimicrobiales bacterium]